MSQLKIKNGATWEEIPAGGIGVPSGGTAGQVLTKSSATDYATEWTTPSSPPVDFRVFTVSGSWTIAGGSLAYVDLTDDVPDGFYAISASVEITSPMNYSMWIFALNPVKGYELNGNKYVATRLINHSNTQLSFSANIHVLCYKEITS